MASYPFIGGNDEEINRISSNRVGYRRVGSCITRCGSYYFINVIGDEDERSNMV
jgi:hypothetical protein